MRLERFPDYHLGPAYLDAVEFNLAGGDGPLMYENDEIHLTGVGLADLERVKDPTEALNADLHQAPPSFSTSYIGMNVEVPPLDDPKVRQALNYTVNKDAINSAVLEGLMVSAKGVIPPGFPSYTAGLRAYEYNPEKAKQLLLDSKYGENLEEIPLITLSISGSFGADLPLDMEVVLKEWEELGLRVEIQQTEWATYLQDLHGRRYQMFRIGWGADYPDPENFLDILFHSKSDNNHTGYNNSLVDSLLERARVERSREARFALYNQAEQIILDDAPWIPLWHSGERNVLIKSNVKDYLLTPMALPKYRYVYFEN
jgi:ABC-type transport system substrate-binding protein